MVVSKVWTMKTLFHGEPKAEDFELKVEELPAVKDGEFLCEAVCWSVDPYNRAYAGRMPAGSPMIGFQVAKVVESKSTKFAVGSFLVGHLGWRTHTVLNEDPAKDMFSNYYPLPQLPPSVPKSAAIGILGMPGMTAYFGLIRLCRPKSGETLVVNAAAGAVGSAVGQIGKILGLKVIGYAGTDEKLNYLKEIGFDHVFNYKTVDLDKSLTEAAPNGVDCFFDNVGAEFAVTVLKHMNDFGRLSICGQISQYNKIEPSKVENPFGLMLFKQLTVEGFIVSRFVDEFPSGIVQMATWIAEGKLKFRETEYQGFDNMPKALMDQLNGVNIGKVVIHA